MAEWLLEIFSEEIPSMMQQGAQEQLRVLAEAELTKAGLGFERLRTFSTPRRLTLVAEGLPLHTPEHTEEKKGPRTDAPAAAIEGFLKTAGVTREACTLQDTPKGQFLFVIKKIPPQPTEAVLGEISLAILKAFHWPKTMRWPNSSTPWIRPIRGFVSLFEGQIVPFTYAGITASKTTQGHRFLAPEPFEVSTFAAYQKKLRDHFVILDRDERRTLIAQDVETLAKKDALTPTQDAALLEEVTGLVEWPIALKGTVDAKFMGLPFEVITTPMRVHQRYFPLKNTQGNLANAFIILTNLKTKDEGKAIIQGNERVLRARLADAQFFWEQDRKHPLEQFNTGLKIRIFYRHLGSLFDKVERLEKLAPRIANQIGAEASLTQRAALLSKADLMSQMVNEFPELQGIMGRYYATHQGEPAEVAHAIEEQYLPKGMGGPLPTSLPGISLAIADRIDSLIGFFAIGIEPTGSKDPYALRRAGLGLIALLLNLSLSPQEILAWAYEGYQWDELSPPLLKSKEETIEGVWTFLLERFKFYLRDQQGSPYDHVEAVLSIAGNASTLADLAARTAALGDLLKTEDGKNLRAAYKRASNILKVEEEKEKYTYDGIVSEEELKDPAERNLFAMLKAKHAEIICLTQQGEFNQVIRSLAELRGPVDTFFEAVRINVEDETLRKNRLHLLALLRKTSHLVADFSKLEGEA